jgi:hypothetical protein
MIIDSHGEITVTGENQRTRKDPVPLPLCPQQVPHGLNRASAVCTNHSPQNIRSEITAKQWF